MQNTFDVKGQIVGNRIKAVSNLEIPVYNAPPPIQPEGSIYYNSTTNKTYKSDGAIWIDDANLGPSLQSLDTISIQPDETVYGIAPNVYAVTPLTSYARTLLDDPDANTARSTLGLGTIATQPNPAGGPVGITAPQLLYNKTIADPSNVVRATELATTTLPVNISASTAPLAGQILVADGSGNASWQNVPDDFNEVIGPYGATNNAIPRYDGTDGRHIKDSSVLIDDFNNMSGITDLSVDGNIEALGTIGGLTHTEFVQLQNINSTIITTTQWGYLSNMDQNVNSGSTPTFTGLNAGNARITHVQGPPLAGTDAANKSYVDNVAVAGIRPIQSCIYATAAILPNAPTYAAGVQTLTSTAGPGVQLVVDGQNVLNGQRILVKDQADNRENGVYIVSNNGAGLSPWVLTRTSDFNQAATPIPKNTATYIASGDDNVNSIWLTEFIINTIDPLTDPVTFIQFGGNRNTLPGAGLYQTLNYLNVKVEPNRTTINGSNAVDISPTYVGQNSIEILGTINTGKWEADVIGVHHGGTGTNIFTSGNVLMGNGLGSILSTKPAPSGDFVGTTDSQVLTFKTITDSSNDVSANKLRTTGLDVIIGGAGPPAIGQLLTATSATTAIWSDPVYDGDVVGPLSSNDEAIVRFDGATGKLIQDSSVFISDSGVISGGEWQGTTVAVSYGGTGVTTLALGNVLVGNNAGPISATKPAPTGNFVGTTDSQILTNKALVDSSVEFIDNLDNTKIMQFQLSGITTGTTQVLDIPDASGEIVLDSNSQSLSNKTITDPSNIVRATSLGTNLIGVNVDISSSAPPSNGQVLIASSATSASWQTTTMGDVTGPGSATDNAVTRFDGATGKLIQNSSVIISDSGVISGGEWQGTAVAVPYGGTGVTTLTSGNVLVGAGTSAVSTTKPAPSGGFVGTTDTQTLSSKSLVDSSTLIIDELDATKKMQFQVSGITSGATRTLTVPNASGTLVLDSNLQSLSNKTITDPSNTVRATELATTGSSVVISGAAPPSNGQVLTATGLLGTTAAWQNPAGNVNGPVSSSDNAVARFDGATGKLIQNSSVIISDSGIVTGGEWHGTAVAVPYGGTGATTFTSGNVLVGNNANPILATKAAPSGDFVGTTDTQTLNGKSLVDLTTFIIDNADISKKMQFQLSGITTSTTRTLTVPNADGTIVLDSNSQILTN